MIRVVNVKGLRTPEQRVGVVYVGRAFAGWPAHPLGNPFRVRPNDRNDDRGTVVRTVESALSRYAEWVSNHPRRESLIEELWEATEDGAKPLGCWCVDATAGDGRPIVCHAQILADMIRDRFCCVVCGKPAQSDVEGVPWCGGLTCEYKMQVAQDYHNERGG